MSDDQRGNTRADRSFRRRVRRPARRSLPARRRRERQRARRRSARTPRRRLAPRRRLWRVRSPRLRLPARRPTPPGGRTAGARTETSCGACARSDRSHDDRGFAWRARRPRRPRPARAAVARGGQDVEAGCGRHVAAADAPGLDGAGVGHVHGGIGCGAGRHRPIHVPQCPQRAAATVQGRLSDRIRSGRGRALEGKIRGVDRPDAGRRGRAVERLLCVARHLHAPGLHAELSVGRSRSSSARATAAGSGPPASTSKARPRGRSSARASCWPTTGSSSSTKRGSFSTSSGSGRIRKRS